MKSIFYSILILLFFSNQVIGQSKKTGKTHYVFVGTYTNKNSEGIYVYKFDPKTLALTQVTTGKGIKNPSFLDISKDGNHVYAVSETDSGSVYSFIFDDKTSKLTEVNHVPSKGSNPCHISLDNTGKWALVSHYSSGSLGLFPINKDGSVGDSKTILKFEGSSVNTERQETSHVHSAMIAPNNTDVFAADLGTDKIYSFTLNPSDGAISQNLPIKVNAGAGPRHFAMHPNGKFLYLLTELDATIKAFDYKNLTLKEIQSVPALPKDYNGKKWCADIHVSEDGKFLYASNRDHESIAIYSISSDNGQLKYVGHHMLSGKTPRNFAIDPTGEYILVAYQDSDSIEILKRDVNTGTLKATGKSLIVSMPVCIKFFSK